MSKHLPFEPGTFYKPKEGSLSKYMNNQPKWEENPRIVSSSQIPVGANASSDYPNDSYYFLPLAFEEKRQMVVGEIKRNERYKIPTFSPQSGYNSFNFIQQDLTIERLQGARIEIEVNMFIREFDKVL